MKAVAIVTLKLETEFAGRRPTNRELIEECREHGEIVETEVTTTTEVTVEEDEMERARR